MTPAATISERYLKCSMDRECWFCIGQTCARCGAGSGRSPFLDGDECTHDFDQRHTEVLIDGRHEWVGGSE